MADSIGTKSSTNNSTLGAGTDGENTQGTTVVSVSGLILAIPWRCLSYLLIVVFNKLKAVATKGERSRPVIAGVVWVSAPIWINAPRSLIKSNAATSVV